MVTVSDAAPQVMLFAVQPSWVRVRAADGTVLFEKILDANEEYVLPDTEGVPTLRAGNAGALYFAVNGRIYGPAGQGPSVVKNVALTPDALSGTYALADPETDGDLARYYRRGRGAGRADAVGRRARRPRCAGGASALCCAPDTTLEASMSLNHVRPWRNIHRRQSRQIMVGTVPVGGDAPITVQTMTNTATTDVRATVAQVQRRAEAGADIVRVSTPDEASDPRAGARSCARARCRSSPTSTSTTGARSRRLRRAPRACRINPGNIGSAAASAR